MKKVDFKKENKELYFPTREPGVINVPSMKFIIVDGKGDPNDPDGEYSKAVELLYALSYTIKMKRNKANKIDSNSTEEYDYVVPPLEGIWWLEDSSDRDFTNKEKYQWISMIRQPEFISDSILEWAKAEVAGKKPQLDVTKARLETFSEGLCVQAMHFGPYATESETIANMETYLENNGYRYDFGTITLDGTIRRHHEIYLSDPRKTNPVKMRTIIRHPVKYKEN